MVPGGLVKRWPAGWLASALLAGGLVAMSWPSEVLTSAAVLAQGAAQADAEFEGELEALYEDGPSSARLLHFLALDETPGGRGNANGRRRLRLEFTDGAPDWPTGTRIRARGRMRDADTLELSKNGGASVVAPIASNTFGEQKTIVILVNFQDNPIAPYTWSHAHATTFQTVDAFVRESSFNQTWLTGDVSGWHTLNLNSGACDYNQIASAADQKAIGAGVNLSAYSRRVYAFPQTGACSWWGLGTVGGNPSRSWINGSYALKVVAHELGHNFGDWHSRSVPCDAGGCQLIEYGDDRDMMGLTATGHFNAFQKSRLGWLGYGASPPIHTVSQAGTYQIESFSAPAGGAAKALRILKSTDGSGNKTWYYVEARTPTGFDASVASGVVIHTGADAVANSSDQIDLDLQTSAFDSTLEAGQTFTDAAAGVSISTVWSNASGAAIAVSVSGTPCSAASPTVTLNPGGTVMTQPGAPVSFDVTVLNNDGASCAEGTFDLASQVPAGWSGQFSAAYVTLAPGASATAGLTVTPPLSAAGSNGHTAHVTRAGAPSGQASGSITVVSGLQVTLSIESGRRGFEYTAAVTAGGAPVPGASGTFTLIKPGGGSSTQSFTTNGSGAASGSFRPKRNDPAGTYQVVVNVSSGALSGTTTGSFLVK